MDDEDIENHDLEHTDFVITIYRIVEPIAHGAHDYGELLEIAPHRAYVLAMEHRTVMIVDRFRSLRTVECLLSYATFPFQTPDGPLSREHWIRMTLDVMLARLTSIRDVQFMFLNELYELGLEPRQATANTLLQGIPNPTVQALIREVSNAARKLRDERDQVFHRGEQRVLGPPWPYYYSASLMELWSGGKSVDGTGPGGESLKLADVHAAIVKDIQTEFHTAARELMDITERLFVAIMPDFRARWDAKRATAKQIWNGEEELWKAWETRAAESAAKLSSPVRDQDA